MRGSWWHCIYLSLNGWYTELTVIRQICSPTESQRGSRQRLLERWMVFNSGWSCQPQILPNSFLKTQNVAWLRSAISTTVGWLDGQADWCPLCTKLSGSGVKIRKGKFNALCYYMWKWWISSHVVRTKRGQQGAGQEAKMWCSITYMFNSQQYARLEIHHLYHLLLLW